MKCETKTDEMIEILSVLQEYVPTHSKTTTIPDPHFEYTTDEFHHLLFGGDQLTVERIRSAQQCRANSNREKDKLMGFLPVVEDWHAEVTFLSVSAYYRQLYIMCGFRVDMHCISN